MLYLYSQRKEYVYVYEDRATCRRVVGKFFCSVRQQNRELARKRLKREYDNIIEFRRYLGKYHHVARPLGVNENLGSLLVVEYCYGRALDEVISGAVKTNENFLWRFLTSS